MGALEVPRRSEVSHAPALHKKSGQKSDSAVNKDFLVSFWRFFEIKKTHFGRKKHRQGTLFVQSRMHPHLTSEGRCAASRTGMSATPPYGIVRGGRTSAREGTGFLHGGHGAPPL